MNANGCLPTTFQFVYGGINEWPTMTRIVVGQSDSANGVHVRDCNSTGTLNTQHKCWAKNCYYLFSAADLAVYGRAHQAAQLLTKIIVNSQQLCAQASPTFQQSLFWALFFRRR